MTTEPDWGVQTAKEIGGWDTPAEMTRKRSRGKGVFGVPRDYQEKKSEDVWVGLNFLTPYE